jgi:hypothetical protein
MLKIDESRVLSETALNFFPGDHLAGSFDQEKKYSEWLRLEP